MLSLVDAYDCLTRYRAWAESAGSIEFLADTMDLYTAIRQGIMVLQEKTGAYKNELPETAEDRSDPPF